MSGMISLDTNIFIYYFQRNKHFGEKAKKVFETLTTGKNKAATSIITLTEILYLKSSETEVDLLKHAFLQTPNLTIITVDQEIAIEAARIRRHYGFRLPDSMHLATALLNKADVFITNDVRLLKFKEIKVVLLTKFK